MTDHLGSYGKPRPATDATFGYFGATLRIHPDLSDLAVISMFGSMAEAGEDPGKAIDALRAIADVLVHPDDVADFWRLASAHRQTMEDVAQLATSLLGAIAERPTVRPSVSSDGSTPTVPTSEAVSPSEALDILTGRPDLQVAVLRSHEAQTS